MPMSPIVLQRLNALALYAIGFALLAAFYFQIALNELPCPLCLLQRLGLVALGIGPVLALRLGPRPIHYGVTLLAALLGAAIASRQVMQHIMPGDPLDHARISLLHVGVRVLRRRHPGDRRAAPVRPGFYAAADHAPARPI